MLFKGEGGGQEEKKGRSREGRKGRGQGRGWVVKQLIYTTGAATGSVNSSRLAKAKTKQPNQWTGQLHVD